MVTPPHEKHRADIRPWLTCYRAQAASATGWRFPCILKWSAFLPIGKKDAAPIPAGGTVCGWFQRSRPNDGGGASHEVAQGSEHHLLLLRDHSHRHHRP